MDLNQHLKLKAFHILIKHPELNLTYMQENSYIVNHCNVFLLMSPGGACALIQKLCMDSKPFSKILFWGA